MPNCSICGEPMPEGEEMFKFHGYSGPCPKPALPKPFEDGPLHATLDAEVAKLRAEAASPRWIADLDNLTLTERQPDGIYKAAYRMVPLAKSDLSAEREIISNAIIPPAPDGRLDRGNR